METEKKNFESKKKNERDFLSSFAMLLITGVLICIFLDLLGIIQLIPAK